MSVAKGCILFLAIILCLLPANAARKLIFDGGIHIAYTMPQDGNLTLGLYGKEGKLLRWLVQDQFRHAGDHQVAWNGLDQWGKPVPAGDYSLKAIYHAPLTTDYQMAVCNPGRPPWPTSDGRGDWLCDEANPQAAVTDGQWVFLASPGSERGCSIIALDETGQRQWGTQEPRHFHPRSLSLALDGDNLYALYSGPETPDADRHPGAKNTYGRAVLVCFDKRTGKLAKFSRGNLIDRLAPWIYNTGIWEHLPEFSLNRIATWSYKEDKISWLWDLRNDKSFSPATYAGQPRYACTDVGESTNALGIAAVGGKLYVSLHHDNKLLVVDATTGRPTGEEIALNAPAGLCATADGHLLAISSTQVVTINPATQKITQLIGSNLVAPSNLTTDRDGNIYVSDWGASFQVKVFDREGHFLHAIGKEGGRPWVGKWDSSGMLVPRGIAVTAKGKLWVAEDDGTPKRVSVWDAKSGVFLEDYIGPTPYGGGTYFWIDPKNPEAVNAEGARFKVDYTKKTYTHEAIAYRRQNRDDPFTPNGHNLGGYQVRILYRNDHEYAFVNTQPNMVSILQRQGDVYRPVAALGAIRRNGKSVLDGDGTGVVLWDSDVGYRVYNGFYPECFQGHGGDNYTWTDTNGDHQVQPWEMRWAPTVTGAQTAAQPYREGRQGTWATSYWGTDIAPDWSLFFAGRYSDRLAIYRLAPRGWTDSGAPIYDIADAKPIIFDARNNDINGLHVTADGKLIVSYNFESKHCPDAMRCYDLDGRALWAIAMPKRLAGTNVHASNAVYDFQIQGLGDVVCTWLYHGSSRPFLITSDGLYVGTLLDDTLLARLLHSLNISTGLYNGTIFDSAPTGPTALWSESAKYFYQSAEGNCYIINGGSQQEYIFKIKGLEAQSVGRFNLDLTLTRSSRNP